MIHYDYTWDLYPNYIKLDEELNTDALGWKEGDYFKFVESNGVRLIKKIDPIEVFAKGYPVNGHSRNS
jgi:hypothetical protein